MRRLLLALLLIAPTPALAFVVDTGAYVGNSAARSISVAFTPEVCTVTGDNTQASYFLTSTMNSDSAGAGTSWRGNEATSTANGITNLTTNAFTINTSANVNSTGVIYTWWCVAGDGSGDFEVGKYTGNAADDRNITLSTITGTPKLVMLKAGSNTETGAWRTASMASNASQPFHEFAGASADQIQDFGAGYFQIGTAVQVNTSGSVYYYIAFASSTGITESSYTGTGADDTNITAPGWQPEAVHIKLNGNQNLVWRNEANGGDNTSQYSFLAFTGTNNIQALNGSGFQVGTDARVNTLSSTYYWFALRDTFTAITRAAQAATVMTLTGGTQIIIQNGAQLIVR